MHHIAQLATDRLRELKYRLDHRNDPPPPVIPPIHDNLSDLLPHEIANEVSVIERRLELGATQPSILEPEGEAGLRYRLSRLKAQEEANKRREKV